MFRFFKDSYRGVISGHGVWKIIPDAVFMCGIDFELVSHDVHDGIPTIRYKVWGSDKDVEEFKSRVDAKIAEGNAAIDRELIEMTSPDRLQLAVDKLTDITRREVADGSNIDAFIRYTVDEFGEFCRAVSSEDGHNPRDLDEGSASEAVDLTICSLALFVHRGGTPDVFIDVMEKKLAKWEAKLNNGD